jgi:hypothetical protein
MSSAEDLWREAQKIEVPAAFAHTPDAYRAGVLAGRVEVLEDLAKYGAAISERVAALVAEHKDITKMAGGFEAVSAFAQDYLRRTRGL